MLIILIFLSIKVTLAAAPDGLNADFTLNRDRISALYFDGEFESLKIALEDFKSKNKKASEEDRIFTFKFLSVVYAADPNTKAKAEYYMYQLFKIIPTVEILDLYVSDAVESIFQKTKERFLKEQDYASNYDIHGKKMNDSENEAEKMSVMFNDRENQNADAQNATALKVEDGTKSNWLPWTLAGVGVAGAVITYMWMSAETVVTDPVPTASIKVGAE